MIADELVVAIPPIPYRGIRPFRYADHAIFFAREEETRLLASLVAVHRGVFLYGDSGTGKTSLVNAGLLPQTQRLGFEPVVVRVQPRAGEELVIEQIEITDDGTEMLASVFAAQTDGSSRVVLSIAQFEERVRAGVLSHRPLLVFDQFEELLTLFEDDDAQASRHALIEMIVRLLGEPLAVKLLFTFREDYLGRVKYLLAARPELVDQALRLGPPSADELETIIRGPFERFPGRFARELDAPLAQRLRAALAERFGTGDVSLSEVQTVCLRLWQSPDPDTLLAEKGVQGLLEDDLDEALDAFPPNLRAAAVALLSQMVTSANTRNVISAEDLSQRVHEHEHIAPALLDEALDRLERESKLVRRERRHDLYLYEITSEFLVPWITQRREELRLVRARRRERRRLLRILGSIAGGLLILAAIVAAFVVSTVHERTEAQRQRAEAQRQASEAMSLALTTSSLEPLKTRPDVSLALAFEAYRERPRAEARTAVTQALLAARRSGLRGTLTANNELDAVAFSPDGKTLATGGWDGTIRLWDTTRHIQIARLTGHRYAVGAVAFSPDGKTLASSSYDGTIRLWNPDTRKPLARLTARPRQSAAVVFSPDGKTLASAGFDVRGRGTVRLWNLATRKPLGRLTGHSGQVTDLAFSPDGKTLATASAGRISGRDRPVDLRARGGTVRLWNLATRKPLGRLTGHFGQLSDVVFSPDGTTLATASAAGTVLWNPRTRRQLGRLSGHTFLVSDIAFSPDGKTLASAGFGPRARRSTVRLWDLATHTVRASLTGHTGSVTAVAFSPDSNTLASTSDDGTIKLWNPRTRTQQSRLAGHTGSVTAVAFSPDRKMLATARYDGTIRLWNPRTRTQVASLTGHTGQANDVEFSPDGKTLASASADHTIRIWSRDSHTQLVRLKGHTEPVNAVAFSPDGKTLASASDDHTVRLWNLATHKQLGRLTSHTFSVNDVAFSPDGKTLASASFDGSIRVWNPNTRKPLARLTAHTGWIYGVAFSPDGKTLASADEDDTVRLWNLATHKQLGRLTGHTEPVSAVAFSPDGKTLTSAGDDGTVRLWDPTTRTQLARLTGHTARVSDVAFSPDGKTLVSASPDMTVRLWKELLWRNVAELRATVCDIILTGLSRSEWAQYAPGIPYRRSCP